jgi:hypothetical protein
VAICGKSVKEIFGGEPPVSIRRLHTTFIKLPYVGALIGRGKPIRPYLSVAFGQGFQFLICEADIDLVVAKEMELMIKVVEFDLQLPLISGPVLPAALGLPIC